MGGCVSRGSPIVPKEDVNYCSVELEVFKGTLLLPETFANEYTIVPDDQNGPFLLGHGSFSSVFKCQHNTTRLFYALKHVSLESIVKRGQAAVDRTKKEVRRGVSVLKTVDHPSIICLKNYYESENTLCVVLELAGTELYDHIVDEGKLTEASAATILRSVVECVEFMHEQNLVHRDLKPENVVLGNDGIWKIIDFGFSRVIESKISRMQSFVGTMNYVAPEVVAREDYRSSVDVWSIGVITFVLLVGYLPFNTSSATEIAKHKYEVSFKSKHWNKISFAAKTFVSRCLSIEPKERPTPTELLEMSFLNLHMHMRRQESLNPLASPTRIKCGLDVVRLSDGEEEEQEDQEQEQKGE